MSYVDKISNYQADCEVILSSSVTNKPNFSDYIKSFAQTQTAHMCGCDIGSGPQGCNGIFFKHVEQIDGCDVEKAVVESLPKEIYTKTFQFKLGVWGPLHFPHPRRGPLP